MTSLVNITVNPAQLAELELTFAGIKNGMKLAIVRAENKTVNTGRSRIVKRLAKEINLKQGKADGSEPGTISRYIRVRKANFDDLSASIILRREGIPLTFFNPIPNRPGIAAVKGGVTVKTRKGRGREVLPGTFVARMKSGHVDIFERARTVKYGSLSKEDQATYSAGLLHFSKSRVVTRGANMRVARLPIQKRFGPTPLGVFENAPGIASQELAALSDVLEKNVDSQIELLLSKQKAAAAERPESAAE